MKFTSIKNIFPFWEKKRVKHHFWQKYGTTEWILISIALVTIFYVIINFFTSLGDNDLIPTTDPDISLENMEEFKSTVASSINSTVQKSWTTHILTNGDEFLADLLRSIAEAEESILITNFIWDDGEFGTTVFHALTDQARAGVRVRVLLDGVWGVLAGEESIQQLTDAGWVVAYFRPLKWWNMNRVARRTHIRDIVVDGKIGYLWGIAISDSWLGNGDSPDSWHDYMFRVEWLTVPRLESVFHLLWAQTTGEILKPSNINHDDAVITGDFISLMSSPSPDMSSSMEYFIWMAITASQKSIHIANPYLVPSKSLLEALKNKARKGVDVLIIVPWNKTDAPYTRWASHSYYNELLESGVRLYEYQPSKLHAKTMVFDGKWSIIGSANLDNRSSRINLEFILGLDDPWLAKNLESAFAKDLKNSREVSKEEQKKKSILFFPLEIIARIFSHQY